MFFTDEMCAKLKGHHVPQVHVESGDAIFSRSSKTDMSN